MQDPRRRDFWASAAIPSRYTDASAVLDLDLDLDGRLRSVTEIEQRAESMVRVGADGYTAPAGSLE